ncbi:MAG: serpin family protein [Dysgonamonadaceae bacterium]|nr:serpin family protein [Dysgonamonadaceae bacterium]MDD4727982.1 serpin family protein [Dysgonamonadaceae bacterium]
MKTLIFSLASLLSVLFIAGSCDKNIDIDDKSDKLPDPMKIELRSIESSMVESDQAFAFDFFSYVFDEEKKDKNENFMVSPFSLSMALAMTWNGSANETKEAIQNTLNFGEWTDVEVNSYFKKLREAFVKTDPSTKLAIANSIWTNESIKILPNFIALNQDYYNATVQSVSFTDPTTVKLINKWAFDNTEGLIKDVLDKTNPNALMYLLNALYFKGIWTSEFDAKNTSKIIFHNDDGKEPKVDMMFQNSHFNYTHDETMQLVELPYGNQAFNMMVLLPKEGKNLTDITQALQNKEYWSNMINRLRDTNIDLFIPKFKTEYSKKMNSVLIDMGMGIAFDSEKANFSRMSDVQSFISFVQQFTYIATDEVGTEAAAVTVVGMETTSMPAQPEKITFKVDKPFIYLIQEKSTGSILFMGSIKSL